MNAALPEYRCASLSSEAAGSHTAVLKGRQLSDEMKCVRWGSDPKDSGSWMATSSRSINPTVESALL